MNEIDILKATRELLSDPKRWNKGKGRCGDAVCLFVAIYICGGSVDSPAFAAALQLVRKHLTCSIHVFNDDATHQDILNLLDKALADAGALL